MTEKQCKKCQGRGWVYEKKTGLTHTCWICLGKGYSETETLKAPETLENHEEPELVVKESNNEVEKKAGKRSKKTA